MNLLQINKKLKIQYELVAARSRLLEFDNLGDLQTTAERKQQGHKQLLERLTMFRTFGMGTSVPAYEIEESSREAQEATEKATAAESGKNSLQARILLLEKELTEFRLSATPDDVIEVQSKKSEIENLIKKLRQTIQREEANDYGLTITDTHPLSVLTAKKEALLADGAMGKEVDTKALSAIEKKLAHEEKLHSSQVDLAIKGSHVINGLKSKLAEYEQELLQVEKYHSELLTQLMLHRLEEYGQEYALFATDLSNVYTKIVALNSILKGYGISNRALSYPAGHFTIPELLLPPCQSAGEMKASGCFFSYNAANKQKALQLVLNDFSGIGIDIPLKPEPTLF